MRFPVSNCPIRRLAPMLASLTMWGGAVFAQTTPPAAHEPVGTTPAPRTSIRKSAAPFSGAAEGLPVEVNADRLEYDADKRVLKATRNVVIIQGADVLNADYAEFYNETQDVVAEGNVTFQREGTSWAGDRLTYNFRTRRGDFGEFKAFMDPFYVNAKDSQRISDREIRLQNATLSTCEGDSPDFQLRSTSATITDGNVLRARNVVAFLGVVPIFYFPYVKKNLDGGDTGFDFTVGYSSAMGAYLLTAYNYRLTPSLKAATHLDLRSRRGVGVGQDFIYKTQGPLVQQGRFNAYYIDDNEPFDDHEEERERGHLIDNERYRLKLSQINNLNERAYLITELNYLSDPDILDDFFHREFRQSSQPENRISLVHRGDGYSAGLELNKVLNDFYGNVDRLPEASLQTYRRPIPNTPLYYESDSKAAYLEKVFPTELEPGQSPGEDYDAIRVDSKHMVYYPTRHYGFLNVIPRAGYRGTYYSKTIEETTTVESSVDTNGLPIFVTNDVTREKSADLRNLFEFGTETSFKGFKTLHEEPLWENFSGLRHIVEPFANYTFVPTPNLERADLYQFDSVDTLGRRNDIQFGVRNKLQTRRHESVWDMVDAVISTRYLLDPDEDAGEDSLDPISVDTSLRLVEWLYVDFDLKYDTDESLLDEFNTQIGYLAPDESRLGLEYRFKDEKRNQIAPTAMLFPNSKWIFDLYARYDFDNSELQEQEYFVLHKTSCLGVGAGVRTLKREEKKDDFQIWFQIYLLAFPESSIDIGR